MCGIIGYTGKNNAVPYLLRGLGRLEYRGYDSAGISVCRDGRIDTVKRKGRLSGLYDAVNEQLKANTGVGHTRWATHGEPCEENAHPHVSKTGVFSVVHNGIIENYAQLREQLESCGVHFSSQTDTEPIAHLLEMNYNGDALEAVCKTVGMLEGSFALGIICRDFPDEIICARRASPLVAAVCSEGGFVASDITAILEYTNEIYKLHDGDIARVRPDGISFFTSDASEIKRESEIINIDISAAEKEGFEHFMLKEIYEQPRAIRDTFAHGIQDGLKITDEQLKAVKRICFVACGSAYHVGVVGKYIFERVLGIPTDAEVASEFRYRHPYINSDCLVIIISQSGETADTLAALRLSKNSGAHTLSIVNVLGSTIPGESDSVIYTHAGPEIAVATTKAYSAQLTVIYLLACYLGRLTKSLSEQEYNTLLNEIRLLDEKAEAVLESTAEKAEAIAQTLYKNENIFFIGRGLDYACAMEASLKLKEISYIHSEAIGAGELKHGTISLIEKDTPVIALACNTETFSKTVSNIREVLARGARVIGVTVTAHKEHIPQAQAVIALPEAHPLIMPSLEVIPMQLLSYYTAKLRGCDIDKPRNLAKSVTVE